MRELDLGNCQGGVTDEVVQKICENLKSLKVLSIRDCRRVTDAGLSGISIDSSGSSNVENGKIFLGTRAEAEIRDDAQRIKELESQKSKFGGGPKIQDLKHLERLEVNTTKISDISLESAFSFVHLKHINLSKCNDITDSGIFALAKSNPCLEEVIMKQTNVEDAGLSTLIQNAPRLKLLDIEACKCVTSGPVLSLAQFCPRLRVLDVSFCSKIRASDMEFLMTILSSLKKVIIRGLHIAECLQDYDD